MNKTKSAMIVIDMQHGFINPGSAYCIKHALSTVDLLGETIEKARKMGIPIFFVTRRYRANGSDVEFSRHSAWENGGRELSFVKEDSHLAPDCLMPKKGDYSLVKPRFSAFFQTELDLILRRLDVKNVILTGTTTPNCIRTTAYDSISLDYNTIVIEDVCSSQTEEIQSANMLDMKNIGCKIISAKEFSESYDEIIKDDIAKSIREKVAADLVPPEEFRGDNMGECTVRLAKFEDIQKVADIYKAIVTSPNETGWIDGIYPVYATAEDGFNKGELYVMEDDGVLVAAAKLNQEQVDVYVDGKWMYEADDKDVMVIHTLVVDPRVKNAGYGTKFVEYYENFARAHGCMTLRMDTNALNIPARTLYKKLGYRESNIIPCDFCGIPSVMLVCIEKKLS